MHTFRLYGQVFVTGLQNTLIYRWAFLLRVVVSFVPLLGTYFLWGAIFEGTTTMAGYTFSSMMTYYIGLIVLDAIASPTDDEFQIAADIKDGRISQILLKPVNFFLYRLSLFSASRCIYTAVMLGPMVVALVFLWSYVHAVPLAHTWGVTVLAVLGSAMLQFMIAYATAMLAFWLLEIGSIVFILYAGEYLAGGHVFPLDLLPAPLYAVAMSLPFAYEYYFPVAVAAGRIEGAAVWVGLAWQWGWVLALFGAAQLMWRIGLKRYTSVGG